MKSLILSPTVTLFDKEQKLDLQANERLVEYLENFALDGYVVFGSTGEFSAFSIEEKKCLIKLYLKKTKKPVFVGTTELNLAPLVELSNFAFKEGVAGVLVAPPFYFAASDENIFNFYSTLATKLKGDIYIYNYPARTGHNMSVSNTLRLIEKHKNIKGIKDTTQDIAHTKEIIKATSGADFSVFSGFDDHFVDNVFAGGAGCISGLSNIAADLWCNLTKAARDENFSALVKFTKALNKLMEIYSLEPNFSLIFKKLLNLKGLNFGEYAIFPYDGISEEKFQKAVEILNEAKRLSR